MSIQITPNDVDIETGIMNCGGEKDFFIEVVDSYYEEDLRSELIKFYDAQDLENYTITVHSLKGTMRLFGANKAADLAEELQYAGEKSDADFIKSHHADFIDAMDQSMNYIKENI